MHGRRAPKLHHGRNTRDVLKLEVREISSTHEISTIPHYKHEIHTGQKKEETANEVHTHPHVQVRFLVALLLLFFLPEKYVK